MNTATATAKPASQPRDLPASAGAAVRVFFSHWSPRLLLALAIAAVAIRIALGEWRWVDAAWALGILLYWPLNEWLIHVMLLHKKPYHLLGRRVDYYAARKHRLHHADPWNLPLVFVPIKVFPGSLIAIVFVFWLLTPDWRIAMTAIATYMIFSLHYEWCHYLAHINWCPPIEYYRRRVREHRLHHFRNEKFWWGVSMGMGDRLLGTAPDPAKVEKSPTTGTLGIA
jgi:hypothetical protein